MTMILTENEIWSSTDTWTDGQQLLEGVVTPPGMAVELGHHCVARGGSASGAQAVPVPRRTSPCTTRTLKTLEQMDWMMAETENGMLHLK